MKYFKVDANKYRGSTKCKLCQDFMKSNKNIKMVRSVSERFFESR